VCGWILARIPRFIVPIPSESVISSSLLQMRRQSAVESVGVVLVAVFFAPIRRK
jgi:hypothetical protein